MIIDLIKRFPVAADRSLLIGEQERNTEAAHAAGIRGLLFRDGNLASFVRDALRLA
jgi:D-glycero-D-manno-heptose 1,7-bisphosphate phosphatase